MYTYVLYKYGRVFFKNDNLLDSNFIKIIQKLK